MEHVALGHGNCVVQRKYPPLVSFTLLPVASLLSPATAAPSPPMSMEATSPSPLLGKLSPPLARRLPRVKAQVVPVIQDCSWQCHVCTYEQDFVPGSRTCVVPFDKEAVTLCSTACCCCVECGQGVVANLIVPTVVSQTSENPAYLFAVPNTITMVVEPLAPPVAWI